MFIPLKNVPSFLESLFNKIRSTFQHPTSWDCPSRISPLIGKNKVPIFVLNRKLIILICDKSLYFSGFSYLFQTNSDSKSNGYILFLQDSFPKTIKNILKNLMEQILEFTVPRNSIIIINHKKLIISWIVGQGTSRARDYFSVFQRKFKNTARQKSDKL